MLTLQVFELNDVTSTELCNVWSDIDKSLDSGKSRVGFDLNRTGVLQIYRQIFSDI